MNEKGPTPDELGRYRDSFGNPNNPEQRTIANSPRTEREAKLAYLQDRLLNLGDEIEKAFQTRFKNLYHVIETRTSEDWEGNRTSDQVQEGMNKDGSRGSSEWMFNPDSLQKFREELNNMSFLDNQDENKREWFEHTKNQMLGLLDQIEAVGVAE